MLRALVATSLLMMTGVLSQAPGPPGAPFAPRAFARDGKIMPYR